MSASTATTSSTSTYTTAAFWERLWRTAGIQFIALFIVAYAISGLQPGVGAPADELAAFYDSHRTRILIGAVLGGLAALNLMWFAAAIRTTLADAGQGGWGAAASASSAAVGGLFFLLITVAAALAYSIAAREMTRPRRDSTTSRGPASCCPRFRAPCSSWPRHSGSGGPD